MIEKYNFVEKMRGLNPKINAELIEGAFSYGTQKHQSQKRASGEEYFNHPLKVAEILADMHMDSATIATALLHDTIEDTTATHMEIAGLFGAEVAELVEGVTKFTKLEQVAEVDKEAQNFRKLLLATAGDVRVLLVKLADRLHNMRTLEHLSSADKRKRIAEETLQLYAPLAGRMGMGQICQELEDLSFRHLHPRAYKTLRSRLRPLISEHSEIFHNIADELTRKFEQNGIEAEVSWRAKKLWSIWKKMERRSISLEQIADLMGFRIIVEHTEDCYRALGIVHTTWQSVPSWFKDYISTPKPNGYQSIHSTIIGPKRQRIDLQIRSKLHHENAEHGIAAHWRYKQSDELIPSDQSNWLGEIVAEMMEQTTDATEFMEHTKLEIFAGYIYCFTTGGRLIVLPQTATPIDFAYAVHTDIGNSYRGAEVNGHQVDMRHRLKDGDQVEIQRSKNSTPQPAWSGIATTSKALLAIRRALRDQQKQRHQKLGWEILTSIFQMQDKKLSRDLLERAIAAFHVAQVDDLLEQVGLGNIAGKAVLAQVYPNQSSRGGRWSPRVLFGRRRTEDKKNKLAAEHRASLPIRGKLPGMAVRFALGHFPIPGDPITGVLIPGEGVSIYPQGAAALAAFEKTPQRWINLEWNIENKEEVFLSRLVVQLAHEVGALATITTLIAEYGSNIDYLELTRSDNNFRTLHLDIEVLDVAHARKIIMALQGLRIIHQVERKTEPLAEKEMTENK